MKKIVVLTGAGMSVESGLRTFRDADGLWEEYPVAKVATHEGWEADPILVTNFYNMLRKKCWNVKPNEGHKLVAALEQKYDVTVVTQNVDNLHEMAGSSKVIHLHGELMKVCSSNNPDDPRYQQLLTPENCEVEPGTKAGDGSLLRPFIVFFGEAVPMISAAAEECQEADIIIAAIGRPNFVTADMVKEGAVIIDVGTTRVPDATRKSGFRLNGDVNFEEVAPKCSYITPVPGGVGPMTICSLMKNTLAAAKKEYYQ